MDQVKTKSCTEELLTALYKNVKMGSESLLNLMPKITDRALREEVTAQLNRYEDFAKQIGDLLSEEGEAPKEESMMTRLSAKMGVTFNTILDSTSTHIAEMIIEGATMGMTEHTKLIREYENRPCSEKALALARETVSFFEDTIERMKQYL